MSADAKNPWEYLENDHMDERFRVAVKQLTEWGINWSQAHVLDLNCGIGARLLNVLPKVRRYWGNDIALPLPFLTRTYGPEPTWREWSQKDYDAQFGSRDEPKPPLLLACSDAVIAERCFRPQTFHYLLESVLCCFGFSTGDEHLSHTLERNYREYLRHGVRFAVLGKPMRWLKPPWEVMAAWPEWNAYDCVDHDIHFQAAEHLEWRRVRVARRK